MSERLSYFITVIVAALGWLVTHYVDRAIKAPTIEYKVVESLTGAQPRAVYSLTNISRTHSFGPLDVQFLPRPSSPIKKLDVHAVEPASEGQGVQAERDGATHFNLVNLMPGSTVDFEIRFSGGRRPEMHIDSAVPIRLTGGDIETWLVRHEMIVLLSLIAFWFLALAGLTLVQFRILRGERDPSPDGAKPGRPEGGAPQRADVPAAEARQ